MKEITTTISIILSTATFTYALIAHNWWLLTGLLIGLVAVKITLEE